MVVEGRIASVRWKSCCRLPPAAFGMSTFALALHLIV
jgi:hypothetical protein